MKCTLLFAVAIVVPLAARSAAGVEVHYDGYVAGLNAVGIDAEYEVGADRYRMKLDYKTVGAFALVLRGQISSQAEGRFVGDRPAPERFFSSGYLRGDARVTQLVYRQGQPLLRQLQPPNEGEREVVAPERQRGTIDTLSAMADLIHQVNTTGRCEGRVMVFDGRRLGSVDVHTAGDQPLEPTGRSSFSGMTTRCEFVGRQLGGFMLDADRAELAKPQLVTAWFASVTPGGPKIPVRIAFRTAWIGEATLYIATQ